MNRKRFRRIAMGLLLWFGIALATWSFFTIDEGRVGDTARALGDYLGQQSARFVVDFPRPTRVEVGTPIFLAANESSTEGGEFIGEIEGLLDARHQLMDTRYGRTSAVAIRLFDRSSVDLRADAAVRLIQVPQTFRWVVDTLLTDKAVAHMAVEWNRTMYRHREEFFTLLTPVVRDLMTDVEELMAEELPAFVKRHEREVRGLRRSLEDDLAGEKLVTLFNAEVWPSVERRLTPVVEKIGAEIWKKFPVWGLSWRFAYERIPLTDDDHFKRAWDHFLETQVIPTIKDHSADVFRSLRLVTKDALTNPEVTTHLRQSFKTLVSSPPFQRLAQEFVKETVLDNSRFHTLVRKQWNSPTVQTALTRAGSFLEPMVRRMGDQVLGTRKAGITAEFARVLRAQILLKDHQRFLVHRGGANESLRAGTAIDATIEWESGR